MDCCLGSGDIGGPKSQSLFNPLLSAGCPPVAGIFTVTFLSP
jgi:hypothetical protein